MLNNRWGWNVRGSGSDSGSTTGLVEQLCSMSETAGFSYFVAYIDLFICKHFAKSLNLSFAMYPVVPAVNLICSCVLNRHQFSKFLTSIKSES